MQSARGQPEPKGRNQWETSSTCWPRSAQPGVPPHRPRSRTPSHSWPVMTQASSTVPCWTLTEAGTQCDLPNLIRMFGMSHNDAPTVSYTHLRAHETDSYLVCRL